MNVLRILGTAALLMLASFYVNSPSAEGALLPQQAPVAVKPLRVGFVDFKTLHMGTGVAGTSIVYREFQTTPVAVHPGERSDDGYTHGDAMVGAFLESYRLLDATTAVEVFVANPFYMEGGQQRVTTRGIANALEWLEENEVKVVVVSQSGPDMPQLRQFYGDLIRKGMIIFASTPKISDPAEMAYPAKYEEVISIACMPVKNACMNVATGKWANFHLDGVYQTANHTRIGTSEANARAAAYGAFYVKSRPGALVQEVRAFMTRAARKVNYEVAGETVTATYLDPHQKDKVLTAFASGPTIIASK